MVMSLWANGWLIDWISSIGAIRWWLVVSSHHRVHPPIILPIFIARKSHIFSFFLSLYSVFSRIQWYNATVMMPMYIIKFSKKMHFNNAPVPQKTGSLCFPAMCFLPFGLQLPKVTWVAIRLVNAWLVIIIIIILQVMKKKK